MEDCLAWCAGTDPFDAEARSRPLSPATVRLRRDQIHAAVTALIESGVEPTAIRTLADLVSVTNFKRIAQHRLKMADGQDNSFNRGVATTLVQIAREWVNTDNATLSELKRLASKLPVPRADLTAKNKRFLRQFDNPEVLQRLRAVPLKLWTQMRRDVSPNFRTLAMAQAAIAVEILIYLPIRMQNLISLTFDVHLFLHEGPSAVSTLDISAGEVKNKRKTKLGIADDMQDADGTGALSFHQAQAKARLWFGEQAKERAGITGDGSFRVSDALDDYLGWYEIHRKDIENARYRVPQIVSDLGQRLVSKLKAQDIRSWHEKLAATPPRSRTPRGMPQRYRQTIDEPEYRRRRRASALRASESRRDSPRTASGSPPARAATTAVRRRRARRARRRSPNGGSRGRRWRGRTSADPPRAAGRR